MAGLAITYGQLRREVGRFLGFDRDPTNWVADETQDVWDVIDSGLRQFYRPPRLPEHPIAHVWSFLEPHDTLVLVVDQEDYDLPADFAGLSGKLYYVDENWAPSCVQVINEGHMLQLRQNEWDNNNQYYPRYAAIVAKDPDETAIQRHQLQIWPKPDAAYTLEYKYHVRPQTEHTDANYPLGGSEHAEAVRASVMAAAEVHLDDERGDKWARFMDVLRSSIDFDQRSQSPSTLGQNTDRTDREGQDGYIRADRLTIYEKYPT